MGVRPELEDDIQRHALCPRRPASSAADRYGTPFDRVHMDRCMNQPRPSRSQSSGGPVRVRMDGSRAEPSDDRPALPKPASSYERYKQQLHSFFNGDKPLPEHLKDMLATRPGASTHGFEAEAEAAEAAASEAAAKEAAADTRAQKKRRQKNGANTAQADDGARRRVVAASADDLALVEAIRKASSPREVKASVDALLARGLPLPKDAEVLGKALGHDDDAVLEQALAGLRDVIIDGSFRGNATLLKTRLKNVALLSSSTAVRDLCAEVAARL